MDRRHELEKVRLLRILLCALCRAKSCVWSVSDVSPCRLSHHITMSCIPGQTRGGHIPVLVQPVLVPIISMKKVSMHFAVVEIRVRLASSAV